MACARLDLPAVFVYGGTILPGHFRGRDVTVQDMYEAVGAVAAGTMSEEDLDELERVACPTAGSCAGMYTANTMAAVSEAIGMALPGSATPPAVVSSAAPRRGPPDRRGRGQPASPGHPPRQIMTRPAFLNAAAVVMASAGSTNAVLHLLAIANEAGVELTMDDFDAVSRRVPTSSTCGPAAASSWPTSTGSGASRWCCASCWRPGCWTATSHRHRQDHGREPGGRGEPDGEVVRRVAAPIAAEGGLAVLRGSLAPDGSVVKIPGNPNLTFRGTAKVFESEEDCFAAVTGGRVGKGRRAGDPQRGPQGRAPACGDAGRDRGHQGRRTGQATCC